MKYRVQVECKNRFGISGLKNIKSKSGSIWFKSKEVAKKRLDDLNAWMKKSGTFDIHGYKKYQIIEA